MEPLPFRKHPRLPSSRPADREGLFVLASAWRRSATIRPFPRPVDAPGRAKVVDLSRPSSPDDGPAAA
jgi:hypothetical protein